MLTNSPKSFDHASADGLAAWAEHVIATTPPDFVIGEPSRPYMRRWWVIPRNTLQNVYLHEILRSDDDRALHDHPWSSTSVILSGCYFEVTPNGTFERTPGSVIHRKATDAHRLVVPEGGRVVSLFFTGPKVREWGFHCPQGFVHWQDFTAGVGGALVGRGCGEP